jgi:excisionase family DNA binding protein
MPLDIDPLYTSDEVAEIAKVTAWTVREWCKAGTLKATKAGRGWRIKESDLKAFLEERHGE